MNRNSQAVLDELVEQAATLQRKSLESWIDCANVLLKAREVAEHGQWLPFLEQAGISPRHAQNMLRIAKRGLKCESISHLGGIGETLRLLAIVEKWPAESRKLWTDSGEPGADLRAAATKEEALELWRAFRDSAAKGSEERRAIIQAVPDGPLSMQRWLDYGEAITAAQTDEEHLAAWEPKAVAKTQVARRKTQWRNQ